MKQHAQNKANGRINIVIFPGPIHNKGINAFSTRIPKSRIETREFRVQMICETINRMRTPSLVNSVKRKRRKAPIVRVKNATKIICPIILRSRNLFHLNRNAIITADVKKLTKLRPAHDLYYFQTK